VTRVLVIAAHPDDTEFVCGGTVAGLADQGAEITIVVVTSGEAGLPIGVDDSVLREAEQRAAADVLGVARLEFLRYPDGQVEATLELRRQLTATIRTVRPDLLITHTPQRNHRSLRSSHPDHLAVGEASLASVYPDARSARTYVPRATRILGCSGGVITTAVVAFARDWTALLDPWLPPSAALLGMIVGMVAGTYPALKAMRVEPVAALAGAR
jgi:LmbE family N-acetylglucosaminyl deacetylase